MKLRWLLIFFLIFSVGFYVYSQTRLRARSLDSPDVASGSLGMTTLAKVKQVVDGDTIKLESGETVRYIGVNTPEIYELENKEDEEKKEKKEIKWIKVNKCYGQEAMRKNQELVEGKVVSLEKETSDRDKFGRLLRDVWINGMMINLELVKEGDAKAMTVPPDKKYEQQILAAEKEAREKGRGLWKVCN